MVKRLLVVGLLMIALVGGTGPTQHVAAATSSSGTSLASAVGLVGRRAGSGISVSCTNNVFITSVANGNIVAAEIGNSGAEYAILRARSTEVGPWELFILCFYDTYYTLQSQDNGLYVSAELGNAGASYGVLRARATAIGPWEQFNIFLTSNGRVVIQSRANGRLVSAELGYAEPSYAMLRARATAIGPWEEFQ